MSIQSKKELMADKMYKQTSKGNKGTLSMKYKMTGKGKGSDKPATAMSGGAGKATGRGRGEGYPMADTKGSFTNKYNQ